MSATPIPLWRFYLLPGVWTLLILILSGDLGSSTHTTGLISWLLTRFTSLGPRQILELNYALRKTAHVVAYGLLFVFYYRAFWHTGGQRRLVSIGAAMGLCLIVALVDEGRQTLVSSRTGSLADVLLDMSGVMVLGFLAALMRRPRARTPRELRVASEERAGGV